MKAVKLSPLNQERWRRFCHNRRGYFSMWLFLLLFVVTLGAELIANDKPIVVKHDGDWFFPVVQNYTELDFGGDFDMAADYRDPYIADMINEAGWMLWPPIRFDYRTINYDLPTPAPSPPSSKNWLGTDDQGRDVLARLIYGFRISVLFGLMLTIATSIIGIAAGAVQGFYGGKVDLIGQRIMEVWSSVPTLFVLIIIASLVPPNFWILLAILLLFGWMALVGVVRAEFLRARNLDYVLAARAMGVGDGKIIFRHLLPNAMVATITFVPFLLVSGITSLTALDFLGFGLPPGSASLGEMVGQGKNNLHAPWIGISVFIVLALLLTLLVFVGEAVRDAVDPNRTR
ncbi:ABC transporter permease [Gilvimarinus agarilyticus]|uniref:ABC transporter permease n=1 Tax=Gilvimarinus sp. 2_MG-2023 TaxID=3062666 RepID=UPI001C093A86|nr:ABC transporter permease [Gilvimarinus sp. 2_MG-2023]MBU2887073.1 ABC transporter permease [Gilvimarinus agarilyticus]MDO6571732.1 ABC transporter permease [Gilvimarinus sp. 2_MG-2023]